VRGRTAGGLLLWLARSYKRALLGGIASGLVWRAGQLASPALTEAAIDQGVAPGDLSSLALWTAALIVVGVVVAVTAGVRHYYAGRCGFGAEAQLRETLSARLAGRGDHAPEELTSRVTADARAVGGFFEAAPSNVGLVAVIIGASAALFATDPWLAGAGLAPLLALAGATAVAIPVLRRTSHRLQSAQAAVGTVAGEALGGIQVVQGLGLGSGLRRRFGESSNDARAAGVDMADVQARLTALATICSGLGLAGLLAAAGWRLDAGGVSAGGLVAAAGYLLLLAPAVQGVQWRVEAAVRAWAAAERLAALVEDQPASAAGAAPLPRGPGSLHLENLRLAGDDQSPPSELTLAPSETVAVVGASGAGKTRLLRLAAGLLPSTYGCARLDGVDVRALSPEARRRGIAVGFGQPFLLADTVARNIALARPDADRSAIEAAARAADIDAEIRALPEGYDTVLGEGGLRLSGGQRQRLGLARALLPDARVLLLDDVTGALDAVTERHVVERGLSPACQGRTVLLATSRPALLALADRVIVLEAGRVIADDAPQALMDHRALQALRTGSKPV